MNIDTFQTQVYMYIILFEYIFYQIKFIFLFSIIFLEGEFITSAEIWFYIKYCFPERNNQTNTTNSQKEIGESSGKKAW